MGEEREFGSVSPSEVYFVKGLLLRIVEELARELIHILSPRKTYAVKPGKYRKGLPYSVDLNELLNSLLPYAHTFDAYAPTIARYYFTIDEKTLADIIEHVFLTMCRYLIKKGYLINIRRLALRTSTELYYEEVLPFIPIYEIEFVRRWKTFEERRRLYQELVEVGIYAIYSLFIQLLDIDLTRTPPSIPILSREDVMIGAELLRKEEEEVVVSKEEERKKEVTDYFAVCDYAFLEVFVPSFGELVDTLLNIYAGSEPREALYSKFVDLIMRCIEDIDTFDIYESVRRRAKEEFNQILYDVETFGEEYVVSLVEKMVLVGLEYYAHISAPPPAELEEDVALLEDMILNKRIDVDKFILIVSKNLEKIVYGFEQYARMLCGKIATVRVDRYTVIIYGLVDTVEKVLTGVLPYFPINIAI